MSVFFLNQRKSAAKKIDCLSINTGTAHLLMPMPAVAEIILNQETIPATDTPEWMFGWLGWRNLMIPLIDFAALQQSRPCSDFGDSTRILVLNSLMEGHEQRYYAIVCHGFPHTISVEEDTELSAQTDVANEACISLTLTIQGELLHLPDFEQIETHLCQISPQPEVSG